MYLYFTQNLFLTLKKNLVKTIIFSTIISIKTCNLDHSWSLKLHYDLYFDGLNISLNFVSYIAKTTLNFHHLD